MNEPRNEACRRLSLLAVLVGTFAVGCAAGAEPEAARGEDVQMGDSVASAAGVPGSTAQTYGSNDPSTFASPESAAPAGAKPGATSGAPVGAKPGAPAGAAAPRNTLTSKLGVDSRFLIGLGNDSSPGDGGDPNRAQAYALGTKLDIHYMYLSGLDWPTWTSPEGAYVTKQAQAAKSHGVVPMFTLYQAAAWGESNLGAFTDTSFMTSYWHNVRVMYQRLGEFGSPSIVHLEPDLWGTFQQQGDAPSSVHVLVGSLVPECKGMPEDASGFGKCLVKLARTFAPKAVVGLSASSFGAYTNGASDPKRIGEYLNKVGSAEADYLAVETLDRDAGCFEDASDPNCQRNGSFYWDESNATHPSFHDHLAWARTIHQVTGKSLLWWQMPLGVPSDSSGGSAAHYRDNRVRYLFAHPQEFVDAGGVGAVFGTGAPNQTTAATDGGQFKNAVAKYSKAPVRL